VVDFYAKIVEIKRKKGRQDTHHNGNAQTQREQGDSVSHHENNMQYSFMLAVAYVQGTQHNKLNCNSRKSDAQPKTKLCVVGLM